MGGVRGCLENCAYLWENPGHSPESDNITLVLKSLRRLPGKTNLYFRDAVMAF